MSRPASVQQDNDAGTAATPARDAAISDRGVVTGK
jgi:hypothetical protein